MGHKIKMIYDKYDMKYVYSKYSKYPKCPKRAYAYAKNQLI